MADQVVTQATLFRCKPGVSEQPVVEMRNAAREAAARRCPGKRCP